MLRRLWGKNRRICQRLWRAAQRSWERHYVERLCRWEDVLVHDPTEGEEEEEEVQVDSLGLRRLFAERRRVRVGPLARVGAATYLRARELATIGLELDRRQEVPAVVGGSLLVLLLCFFFFLAAMGDALAGCQEVRLEAPLTVLEKRREELFGCDITGGGRNLTLYN